MRHITWENFKRNFIDLDAPGEHPILGEPPCHLFVDQNGRRIGLRIQIRDSSTIVDLPYQHIEVSTVHIKGALHAQVSCEVVTLHEAFFAMLTSAADLIQERGRDPMQALQECAEKFFSLLSSYSLLSPEKQVGLWCELWALERLIRFTGTSIVGAWIGPLREPHDFRMNTTELEVKGTRGTKRSHLISSEDQLSPSEGCDLFLLSLQLEPAIGEGCYTLTDIVNKVRRALSGDQPDLERFDALLKESGYLEGHARFYVDCFRLRKGPTLIPVVEGFPRVTKETLSSVLDESACRRISELKYRLDVTHLGFEEEDDEFQRVFRTIE